MRIQYLDEVFSVKRQVYMGTRRLVHLSIVFLLVTLSCQFIRSIIPPEENPAAVGSALLNEVLFLPAQGEAGFVEIKSPGKRVSLEGLYLMNERGDSYSLPDDVNTLSPDEFLLIIFDGTNSLDDKTIHANQTGFLNPESGFVELYTSDGTLLDHVAWGADQVGAVNLSRGGVILDLEPGLTIGRFPLSTLYHPLEWTIFYSDLATPGRANPQPAVDVMIPLNGAVIKELSFELSWYPAPGAVEYRVQVSNQDTFGDLLVDETTNEPAWTVELQTGTYFWRVQAIAGNGALAEFSPVQKIAVDPGFSSLHSASPQRQTTLGVPLIGQRKDTQMLVLESKNETGEHAWDVAHPELDRADPADNMNCALASIAMINAFYGGNLSQDRIGFEVLQGTLPGPEWDLMYGRGLHRHETTEALEFALEGTSIFHPEPETLDALWADIQFGIDARAPILAAQKPGHAIVITGYYEDASTRYVMINDPWWGAYAVDITAIEWKYYWLTSPDSIPTLNDPEIGMDSDGDGIVDFDEINRFGTNPNDRDTDKDNLEDKDDLRASIYDEQWGYAVASLAWFGRDYDNDGIRMELDEDSDGGGCFDGLEDFDLDGKFKEPETWNFDEGDDACFFGTYELVLDTTTLSGDGGSHHQRLRTYVKFSLQAVEAGKLEGLAQITYTHTGEFSSEDCSGTHDIGTQVYEADLAGEFQKMPDGGTLVNFQSTPAHGPSYITEWITNCPAESQVNEGWAWGSIGGTLKDGVYDLYTDYSSSLSGPGEFWQKLHMEQGQGME
jgi:hypothetical protein